MSKRVDDEIKVIKEEIDKIVCNYDIENIYSKFAYLCMY